MPQGSGKYDDLATQARTQAQASAVVLIVFGGQKGSGFSVQAHADLDPVLPPLLRQLADMLDEDTSTSSRCEIED